LSIRQFSSHLKKNLLVYTIAALLAGFLIGYVFGGFFASHSIEVKNTIIIAAISTIYPSMIQLRLGNLLRVTRSIREVLLGLIVVFAASPVLSFAFANVIPDLEVRFGFVTSNVVPASSASLGYVLLAEGNIELATILAVLSLIGAPLAVPAYIGLYAGISSIAVPVKDIIESTVYTLVTPLAAGQFTRYLIVNRRVNLHVKKTDTLGGEGPRFECLKPLASRKVQAAEELGKLRSCVEKRLEEKYQPLLSLATMLSMLVLISLLIANKASLLVEAPILALDIILLQAVTLGVLLGVITLLDRMFHITYGDHSAIAFISATKNQSVAAAIAVMALGPKAAIAPALIPAIQAPVAITYLQALPSIRKLLQG